LFGDARSLFIYPPTSVSAVGAVQIFPFSNISELGEICMGKVKNRRTSYSDGALVYGPPQAGIYTYTIALDGRRKAYNLAVAAGAAPPGGFRGPSGRGPISRPLTRRSGPRATGGPSGLHGRQGFRVAYPAFERAAGHLRPINGDAARDRDGPTTIKGQEEALFVLPGAETHRHRATRPPRKPHWDLCKERPHRLT
jgi:hypothetical protein